MNTPKYQFNCRCKGSCAKWNRDNAWNPLLPSSASRAAWSLAKTAATSARPNLSVVAQGAGLRLWKVNRFAECTGESPQAQEPRKAFFDRAVLGWLMERRPDELGLSTRRQCLLFVHLKRAHFSMELHGDRKCQVENRANRALITFKQWTQLKKYYLTAGRWCPCWQLYFSLFRIHTFLLLFY